MRDLTIAGLVEDLTANTVPMQVAQVRLTERLWRPSDVEITVRDDLDQAERLLPRVDWRTGTVVRPDGSTYLRVGDRPFLPLRWVRDSRSRTIKVGGPCVGGMFDVRVIVPPAGQSHQVAVGTTTARMAAYVDAQAAAGAPAGRKVPHLTVTAAAPAGVNGRSEERFSVLSDVLAVLGEEAGIGWDVTLDGAAIRWSVLVGADRSDVVLSAPRLTVDALTLSSDVRDTISTVYVAGQGEGATRTVVVRGGAAVGLVRREQFRDARDTADTATLEARGDADIAASQQPDLFDVAVAQTGPERYGRDYGLGDVVTVQEPGWGLTAQARVVEAVTTISGGSDAMNVEVGLGRALPTTVDRAVRSAEPSQRI